MTRLPLLAVFVLAVAAAAEAQGNEPRLQRGEVTVSGGATFAGGYPVGDTTANLRRNTNLGTPPPFPFLRAESDILRAFGFEARVGVAITPSIELEVGGGYVTPRLDVTISQDDEVDERVSITERLTQYTVDVSGVYLIPGAAITPRMRPYVIGGGGYLRQLHEGRLDVETGTTFHVGGGVRYWLRGGRPKQQSLGVRGEVRLVRRTGGIEFEDEARTYPAATMLAFVGF